MACARSRQTLLCSMSNLFRKSEIIEILAFKLTDTKSRCKLIYCVIKPTFMLVRCSWDIMCARTEEEDEDINIWQTVQWKTSTLVMWSFSWRASKKTTKQKKNIYLALNWKYVLFFLILYLQVHCPLWVGWIGGFCVALLPAENWNIHQSDLSVLQIS